MLTIPEDQQQQQKYDPVRHWLLSLRESSRAPYISSLNRYLRKYSETAQEFLFKSKENILWITTRLDDYYAFLGTMDLAATTKNNELTAVRSFLKWNGVRLPRAPLAFFNSCVMFEPRKLYTKEQVSLILRQSRNWRDASLISLLYSTGQRIEVIRALRYGMVREGLEKGLCVVEIPSYLTNFDGINANKTSGSYQFGFGRQSSEFILNMIEERESDGDRFCENTILFRGYGTSSHGFLTNHGAEVIIDTLSRKAGIQRYTSTPRTSRAFFHPHGFRRTWKSMARRACRASGLMSDELMLRYMMGKNLPDRSAYDEFEESDIEAFVRKTEDYFVLDVDSARNP